MVWEAAQVPLALVRVAGLALPLLLERSLLALLPLPLVEDQPLGPLLSLWVVEAVVLLEAVLLAVQQQVVGLDPRLLALLLQLMHSELLRELLVRLELQRQPVRSVLRQLLVRLVPRLLLVHLVHRLQVHLVLPLLHSEVQQLLRLDRLPPLLLEPPQLLRLAPPLLQLSEPVQPQPSGLLEPPHSVEGVPLVAPPPNLLLEVALVALVLVPLSANLLLPRVPSAPLDWVAHSEEQEEQPLLLAR